ncbi:MAG: 2OG-Fe(II) oxygenase [Bacteroidia bacterium]|nr:2OG-Fe(II) oxygenase [Bacteroidia bacterium]MBT8268363.1 2OG-Fe(II) oxygenase [Bacteroidia bacterium]NNF83306.1 2OG-Fe(II) oxygenase [Flavobacteriaceae bacterium]NNK70496.1 2OG-Fe(II) oxygenase [Flavobacteriaceae bacterium]NNL79311.1 2OG-Fe(II) oxygenase [Flavobacteriaceae bacterium]
MNLERGQLADLILKRLNQEKEHLSKAFQESSNGIGHLYLDDLLPADIAHQIYDHFPETEKTVQKKSLREYKHVAVQMDRYHPLLEEVIYAFQDKRIVSFFKEICGIGSLIPDPNLYAGGLSIMEQHNFLNPHLDNSHDKDRNLWRVLNLLYYVSPGWTLENGGNLELWPDGLKSEQLTIVSKFNRLAVMATHQRSWHSVSKVVGENRRCCVSNYYFSEEPLLQDDSFHVTSFRGWPGQKVLDLILKADSKLRMGIRKIFSKGIRENPHVYKNKD